MNWERWIGSVTGGLVERTDRNLKVGPISVMVYRVHNKGPFNTSLTLYPMSRILGSLRRRRSSRTPQNLGCARWWRWSSFQSQSSTRTPRWPNDTASSSGTLLEAADDIWKTQDGVDELLQSGKSLHATLDTPVAGLATSFCGPTEAVVQRPVEECNYIIFLYV